jgi:hypothetical protein
MPFATLMPHPSTPCEFVHGLTVEVQWLRAGALRLVYRLEGDIACLNVPAPRQPARADELWRHTCFEIFVRTPHDEAYVEFNFAPSGLWAAYRFAGYRSGMTPMNPVTAPSIVCRQSSQHLGIDVQLDLPQSMTGRLEAALSAILEDRQGKMSYWALAHPQGKPDFHDTAGFALSIDTDTR